jgi:hypothetical protein
MINGPAKKRGKRNRRKEESGPLGGATKNPATPDIVYWN